MDDVIDLGHYVRGVVRRWWAVVVLAVVGALTGYVVSKIVPPVYEAGTTLLVTTPKLRTDFDARFRSTLDLSLNSSLNRTFFNMIENRELEARVLMALGDSLTAEERVPGALLERIEATQIGGDTSYFQIKARHRDPEMAQLLANSWASEYRAQVDNLYGLPQEAEGEIGEGLEGAQARLSEAEEALEAFQRDTGIGLVDNIQYPATFSRQSGLSDARNLFGLYERYGAAGDALESKNLTLGRYMAAADLLQLIIAQAERLEGQDQTVAGVLPLELLTTNDVLAERDRLDPTMLATQNVDAVVTTLKSEAEALQTTILALQADVGLLQEDLAAKQRRLTELVRERQLAEESYIILSLKEREVETQTMIEDSWLQVVSPAELPRRPVAPSALVNTFVGFALGGLLGVLSALILTIRSDARQPLVAG
jgi:uncharacterized protein involved in exopolysaccharide biosynthesis